MLRAAAHDPVQVERYAAIIQEQMSVITESLQRLVAFSRTAASPPEPVDLAELMQQAVDLVQPVASARSVKIDWAAPENPVTAVDRGALLHLLTTIVAAVVLDDSGVDCVSLEIQAAQPDPPARERSRARPGPHACLRIRCPGLRLPESILEDAYQPWFARAETHRAALELALAVAWGIARDHGGWVDARQNRASETTFVVSWPLHSG